MINILFYSTRYYKTYKPNSDIIDILGFLSSECVGELTRVALKVKAEWDACEKENREKLLKMKGGDAEQSPNYLFGRNTFEQQPLIPSHIHEAFRRLQDLSNSSPLSNFRGGLRYRSLFVF